MNSVIHGQKRRPRPPAGPRARGGAAGRPRRRRRRRCRCPVASSAYSAPSPSSARSSRRSSVGAHARSTLPPPASQPARQTANPTKAAATAARAGAPPLCGFTVDATIGGADNDGRSSCSPPTSPGPIPVVRLPPAADGKGRARDRGTGPLRVRRVRAVAPRGASRRVDGRRPARASGARLRGGPRRAPRVADGPARPPFPGCARRCTRFRSESPRTQHERSSRPCSQPFRTRMSRAAC